MINNKEKKCIGIGRAKGFKGCGKLTLYRKYGLCNSCYPDFIMNTDTGKILLRKAIIKAQAPRIQSEQELLKGFEENKNRNKITTLLRSVKDICHRYIRLRDSGKPCISCLNPWHDRFQAGHFYKSELFSTIRFNELNINGQCQKCNLRKEGNESEYRVNLPNRIGLESFNKLNDLASIDHKLNHKWDREELIKIRNYYNQKIKELKNN